VGRFALLVLATTPAPGAPVTAASPARRPTANTAAEPPAGYVALASAPPQQTVLVLPFAGVWGVIQGMDGEGTHHGYAAYALDFVPAEPPVSERTFHQRKRLDQHPCYGRPILAPADGRVVWARDGERELPPFQESKRHEAGNFIILQHTADEFTEFRHLQRGSLTVKLGDNVRAGQMIGRCGNSGNAVTPHLHFAFLGSYRPIATRPMRLSHYDVMTTPNVWQPGDGEPKQGQILRPGAGG
jgi:murein DD-endopeptidase MepM/ murein hydrolase activator NlpD